MKMKSKIKIKEISLRIFFLFVILLITNITFSQTEKSEKIKITDAGSGITTNGSCTISLTQNTEIDSYYIILTPYQDYSELYVSEKTKDSFIVKSKNGTTAKFDYIVIRKRIKEVNIKKGKNN